MDIAQGWYVLRESRELGGKSPLAVTCFGKNLVLWRTSDGSIVAMEDRCPHRSAKLSRGTISADGLSIACPYHGFEFGKSGNCRLVPETNSSSSNLAVKTFSVCEQNGFIWIWNGEQEPDVQPPWFAQLDNKAWSYGLHIEEWTTHISRCIENQLDYAHLPYVHASTIGKNMDLKRKIEFVFLEDSISFSSEGSSESSGLIQFQFPGLWMLTILPDKFAQLIAFVPVHDGLTRIYLRTYQRFCLLPGISQVINMFASWQSRMILKQDYEVVISQGPSSSLNALDEKLFPSDKAVNYFRQKWR